ncbi:MAG TPA: TIM-barrel domain-containing protein [Solirubrobacteraceae bacterium]|jgi:alpha-glucosidase (family GH31 glycosyl hydrolase)|nr:TIM-barrel domain-containing protein [Solirubrobacteraceae bacterium]
MTVTTPPAPGPSVVVGPTDVVIDRAALRIELALRPFEITVRRNGRRLLRGGGVWVAEGEVHDQLIHLTEGVIAREERAAPERAWRATVLACESDAVELGLTLSGGRQARLRVAVPTDERVQFTLAADGTPLRLALEWDQRAEERFVGLGARHSTRLDQAGRTVQLGADRRYTGPDCPPELLEQGGIPQGDYAPVPWLGSSRGYGLWVRTDANGTQFDLSGDRVCVSTRANAGPLRMDMLCDGTPAARLRAFCRLTGFAPVLAEWGYGFWKSRDFHEHRDDVIEDLEGFREHRIPLDAIVIDSPWETQYNTWEFNPHQFPDAPEMVARLRARGVRTVLWITPWVNTDSRDGQIPPQVESQRLHERPAENYAPAAAAGHFVRAPGGEPFLTQWWMGDGSPVDFTSPAAEEWWRMSARRVLALGVEGIKADDGEGYYIPDDVRLADGRTGAEAAWALGGLYRESMQRALDEEHPGQGVVFGRSGWTGQHATGMTWAGDQASDFWSLRVLVVATLAAASTGFSNWSHDVGGYLGHRLVEPCPPELFARWLQFGCFTALMHAHSKMPQEPWRYGDPLLDIYRAYVVLHEQLVPYVRAAAATAARTGLPIVRPLCLTDPGDPRGWTLADAYGYGPALWVAPVLDEGAREREVALPRGEWIETWSGGRVRGGQEIVAPAPLHMIPVWVREGSIVVTYPAAHVADGLGDTPESERPLEATLWGEPRLGSTAAVLADGTRISWRRGRWSVSAERDISFMER